MAGSYVLPQVRVFQEFAMTPNDVTQSLNAFLIGPCYQLMRYSRESERGDCAHDAYTGVSKNIAWSNSGLFGSVVDKTWYGVTFEDAYVALGDPLNAACLDATSGSGVKFEVTLSAGKTLANGSSPLFELQFGVPVRVGDYISYMDGSTRKYSKIRELSIGTAGEGEVTPSVHKKGSTASALGTAFTVNVGAYKGEKPATVTVTVKNAASTPTITWFSDVAGITSGAAAPVELTADHDLGLGLKVTKGTNLENGVYIIKLDIASSYVRDTVTVSDLVPYNTSQLTFVRRFDSIECLAESLTPGSDGVTISAQAEVDLGSGATGSVLKAEAYLDQRNLRVDHTDTVYSVRSDGDIVAELGAYDTPDNPLAYAAHIMMLNSANKAVKVINLVSNDAAGYTEALKRASLTTDVYAFCPLTEDKAIIDSIVADCNRLSLPEEKSWRIAIFSCPTPKALDVTPMSDGVYATCEVSSQGVLTCESAQFSETVRVGDTVTVTVSGVPRTARVLEVTSNTTLKLDGWTTAVSAGATFRIVHTRSPGEYVEAIAGTSSGFKDRRAYNVFPNHLTASDGHEVSGMYAAAAVCALACSVAPQQPITNVEVKGFSDIPEVYSKLSRDELNTIAAGGTLILMQDKMGGQVYVRHQISTAYGSGINSTELSLVKNLDSISYYFANRTAPYIGRYNITDDLLVEIRGIIEDGLAHLETTTETNRLIGPQVIAEGTEIRSIYRDPAEKDKAYANVALNLPAPFNNFDLHLQVI